jgi:hypothetical protein
LQAATYASVTSSEGIARPAAARAKVAAEKKQLEAICR